MAMTRVNEAAGALTNLNEARLHEVLAESDLAVKKTWTTGDARPGREHEQWLNAILVKEGD